MIQIHQLQIPYKSTLGNINRVPLSEDIVGNSSHVCFYLFQQVKRNTRQPTFNFLNAKRNAQLRPRICIFSTLKYTPKQ